MNAKNGRARPRLLGYARVSTAEQAQEGISLAAQEARMRAHATAHDLDLVAVETDAGLSGKRTENRPALQRALAALKAGDADGLVVVKLDRLTRSIKDVITLVERSDREDWRLVSIAESLDTKTAMGRFVVHLLGALAQLEREQIGERTKSAMAELKRQGRRVSGKPPLGFKFVGGQVVEVPEEMEILREMLRLQSEGSGAYRIARILNERGAVNPRTGRDWFYGTVQAVLRSAARPE